MVVKLMDTNSKRPDPVDVTKKENTLKKFIESLKSRIKEQPPKRRLIIVSAASVAILVVGVGALQMFGPKAAEPDPVPVVESTYEPPPEPTTEPSRLTGVEVEKELNKRPVTAVMIENSIDARPQAGLNEAGIVFEAIAEGGITRFLALFQTEQPEHIGPIRSARPYYVRWARGFDAAYVHSGGSVEAKILIPQIGVKDVDHGNYPGTFDRVSNRFAPHNVYTSMARLDALREQLGYTTSDFTGFDRIIEEPEEESEATEEAPVSSAEKANSIVMNISSSNYNTTYSYNPDANKYARFMGGVPHTDERSGEHIHPSVVVAFESNYNIHPNGIHSVYAVIGSGNATVYQNGEVHNVKWSKPTDVAELKFTTASGKPFLMQPGQTWITAIQAGKYSHSL